MEPHTYSHHGPLTTDIRFLNWPTPDSTVSVNRYLQVHSLQTLFVATIKFHATKSSSQIDSWTVIYLAQRFKVKKHSWFLLDTNVVMSVGRWHVIARKEVLILSCKELILQKSSHTITLHLKLSGCLMPIIIKKHRCKTVRYGPKGRNQFVMRSN